MVGLTLGAFYGLDSLIDFLVVIVATLIFYQTNKVYNILKDKKYFYFSAAFLSISIAYVFKILANLTAIHRVIIKDPNFFLSLVVEFKSLQIMHFTSFVLFKFFLVVGFLTLLLITKRSTKKDDIPLFMFFSIIAVLFSIYFNFIFHLTIILILAQLTNYFYVNYKSKKSPYTKLVFIAFSIILISHFIDLFYGFHLYLYLIGEIFVLIGFLFLLINHLKIHNGKEKNKTRSDKRPSKRMQKR